MGIPLHSINMLDGSTRSGFDLARLHVLAQLGVTLPTSVNAVTLPGTITAGTAFTSLPTITPTGGTGTGLTILATSLTVVSATVVAGGTSGFANADTMTLTNGVILAVATNSSGVVATVTVSNGGAFLGAYPALATNPVSMAVTNGSGVGIPTFTLVYGLGSARVTNSGNYTVAPTGSTVTGGGGSGASLATTTRGGNGNAVAVAISSLEPLPDNYFVLMSSATAGYLTAGAKTNSGFSISATPALVGSTFTIPTLVDVLVLA